VAIWSLFFTGVFIVFPAIFESSLF
jgi:hypothetical protein